MLTPKKKLVLASSMIFIALGGYLLGAYSLSRNTWPIEEIRAFKRYVMGQPAVAETIPLFDGFGRLTSYPGKTEIECPKQTDKTLVLLIAGQSNTGNHAGQRYESNYGSQIINFWNGKCYKAESPLLGTTGVLGESWTLLANKLIKDGLAEQVVLVSAGIGGTPISRWQSGGDLNKMLIDVVKFTQSKYKVTQVLWHQGESDYGLKTSDSQYTNNFNSLVQSLRKQGVEAPILPSVATKCGIDPTWSKNTPVALAQNQLPDKSKGVYAGPNTDALLNKLDRYDDCHFSGTGQEKFANAWVDAIKKAK